MKRWTLWLVVLMVIGFGAYRWVKSASGQVLGESVADQGREHITDISREAYNSNPPTSGKHFAVWAKKGVYDRMLSDGYLIHSLEHGYVIVSYDCTKLATSHWPLATSVYAHEEGDNIPEGEPHEATGSASGSAKPLMRMETQGMSFFTPGNAPKVEVELPSEFGSEGCRQLQNTLTEFYNRNKSKRLIVVPRIGMDTPIALTAWNHILKLQGWDEKQVQGFLDTWENRGPEKTVE